MTTPQPFNIKLCTTLLSLIMIVVILYAGEDVFIPLAFSCLWAILLLAPCNYLKRKKVPYILAISLSMLASVIVILLVISFITSQIVSFRNDFPVMVSRLESSINQLESFIQSQFGVSAKSMSDFLNMVSQEGMNQGSTIIKNAILKVSGTLAYVVLIPIYTFLILIYKDLLVRFLTRSFSDIHSDRVQGVLHQTKSMIKSYVVGLVTEMGVVAFLTTSGLLLLGVEYAFLIGILTGILNLIPYLGILVAAIISALITLTTSGPVAVLGVMAMIAVVQFIDNNILLPKIVGSKLRINALATLIGVVIGGSIWGIAGMFLAVPMVAILKIVFDEIEDLQAWGILLGEDDTKPVNVSEKKTHKINLWKFFQNKKG